MTQIRPHNPDVPDVWETELHLRVLFLAAR